MEMVTCEHDIASIGNLLGRYKTFVETENFKCPLVKVIVVDGSWAIHAILREWLDNNIEHYLKLTYDFVNHAKNITTDWFTTAVLTTNIAFPKRSNATFPTTKKEKL